MERHHEHEHASHLPHPQNLADPLCSHIYKTGRLCRQPVAAPNARLCSVHLRTRAQAAPPYEPLAELANELADFTEIKQVSAFLGKVLKLACQNRISPRRAAVLTYMANSIINALRLQQAADARAAKENPEEFTIDWSDFPRPPRHNTTGTDNTTDKPTDATHPQSAPAPCDAYPQPSTAAPA